MPPKPIIAVHSREQRDGVNLIKQFYLKFPQYRWVTFRDMRGLTPTEFSNTLQDCFLSVWIDEASAYGTFPLESMKSGVPVLGLVPNMVPLWMNEDNGLWVNNKTQMADFVADFLQNWLEDNVSESIYNGMKTTVESLITKETFETKVVELFDSYIAKRLESFEEQLNKLETTE
jgi:glycosyltransferase involved in cell wall biosynthesis